jgi:hypothetical protein
LQLERWCKDESSSKKPRKEGQSEEEEQPSPYQYSLQLLVPPGQLELGRRLITAMYSSSPDLSDLEAPQLMQLVTLAECYGVGKVVECAAAQLHKLTVKSMPLDIAASVFDLPEACLALEAVRPVQQAAADKLQQELGDLEVVWGDNGKQQQLLGLPLNALLQLLRDERTRVASEDTAVYTALRWLQGQPSSAALDQQQHQFVELLRLVHCTATFLAWLAEPGHQPGVDLAWVYDRSPKLLADLLAVFGRSREERRKWLARVYKDKAAWRLPPRPASAVTQLQLSWDVPLKELEVAGAPGKAVLCQPPIIWRGRRWWLALEFAEGIASGYVCISGATAFVSAAVMAEAVHEGSSNPGFRLSAEYMTTGRGGQLLAWGTDRKEWPQVKAWLLEKGLVHPDGCLHLRATVNRVD